MLLLDDVDDEKRHDDNSDDDGDNRESDEVWNQGFKGRSEHAAWVKGASYAVCCLVLEEFLEV